MEVILREDVPHLGTIGDVVACPGYAATISCRVGSPRWRTNGTCRRSSMSGAWSRRTTAGRRRRGTGVQKSGVNPIVIQALAKGKLFGSVTNIDIERA